MKICIFGGKGYLGQKLVEHFPGAIAPTVDIADQQAVRQALEEYKPDVVINAAGKTGRPNVDWCEDHKEETIRSNVTGPLILLDECMSRGIYFVHLSSGCIYAGDETHEYTENEEPNFDGSFYSRTKAWADQILQEFPVLILRLRMPFDDSLGERTLLGKLIKYDRVLDVRNSLTYIPDFLSATQVLVNQKKTGIYNIVNPGAISPYEVMLEYQKTVDPSHTFEKLTIDHLSEVVKAARSNCVLSAGKVQKDGFTMRPVQEALTHALEVIKYSK